MKFPMSTLNPLFAAIAAVEGWRGPGTVGDKGEIGPLQITLAYWQDSGVAGRHADCEDAEYSRRVCVAYWRRFCPSALRRGDALVLATVHHYGPEGMGRRVEGPDGYCMRVLALCADRQRDVGAERKKRNSKRKG